MADKTAAAAAAAANNNNGATEESSEGFGRVKAPPVCNDSELKKEAMSAETLQQWVFRDDAAFPSAATTVAPINNNAVTRIPGSGWSRSSIASAGGTTASFASGGHGVGSHSSSSQVLPSGTGPQPKVPVSVVSVSSNNSCGDSHAAFSSDELHLDTTHQHHSKATSEANINNNNIKPPPPDEDLNAKVALRKISRQGRSSQRWFNSNDSIAGQSESGGCPPIRLVTGCVPILQDGRIMFVSSSRKPAWILPKGGWESDEKMEESAVRECFEEAGCLGTLGPALTSIVYETRKAKKRRLEQEQQQKSAKSPKLLVDHHPPTVTAEEAHPASMLEGADKDESSLKPAAHSNGTNSEKEDAANGSNVEASLQVASETTEKEAKTVPSTTTTTPTASGATTMSADTISRIRNSSNHQTDETMSVGSTLSTTYSQVQMTLFPLYVREIKVEWPEQGRFRRALPIDEAIALMESRPEFRAALLEVKERGLHTVPTTSSSSSAPKDSETTMSENKTNES